MIGWFVKNELDVKMPGRTADDREKPQDNRHTYRKSNCAPPEKEFGAFVVLYIDTNVSKEAPASVFRIEGSKLRQQFNLKC